MYVAVTENGFSGKNHHSISLLVVCCSSVPLRLGGHIMSQFMVKCDNRQLCHITVT